VPSHWLVAWEGGWSCTCKLGPACKNAGKHPRVAAWQDAATTEARMVEAWWTEWPDANVSVVLGAVTGMFVVDVDPRDGGYESMTAYGEASQFGFTETMRTTTGSGGMHLFYRWPEQGHVGNKVGWMPGIDIRGEGGQVVVPPSHHKSGGFYTWASGWDTGAERAPEELVRALTGEARDGVAGGGLGGKDKLPSASEILAGVAEGERNDTLFRWGCQLRRKLSDDRGAVELLVREAGRNAGLLEEELTQILDSVFRQEHEDSGLYGTDELTEAQRAWAGSAGSRLGQGGRGPDAGAEQPLGGSPGGDGPVDGGLAGEEGASQLSLPLTDRGNGYRFARMWGGSFKWVEAWGRWLFWDGRRWCETELLEHREAAARCADNVWHEAADVEDLDLRKALAGWAKQSSMSSKREAMLSYAQPLLAVRTESVDQDDWLMNVRNGTLDLRTGELREHDPADLMTKLLDVAYDPGAGAPMWRDFVAMVLPDPNVAWYVQKAVGYSLTGSTDAKCMFILHGDGNNGKSVFLEALRENVYGDLSGVVAKSVVVDGKEAAHTSSTAALMGKRFVTLSGEVQPKDKLRTELLKAMTGGDEMSARFLYREEFTFKPKLKLWIATNHRPRLDDFGDAMRTRLRMVPFEVAIPVDRRRNRDEVMVEFRAEAPGILAWAMEGLAGWHKEGLEPPSAVVEAVEDWVDDEDVLGQWVTERGVTASEAGFTSNQDVHQDYVQWMAGRGEERYALSPQWLSRRLASLGFKSVKSGGRRGWHVEITGASQLPHWPAGGVN
jgi:putative DNA primase/helicase